MWRIIVRGLDRCWTANVSATLTLTGRNAIFEYLKFIMYAMCGVQTAILKKPMHQAPLRLQNMILRLKP